MTDQAALLSSPLARGPGALPRQRQLIQRLKQAILAGQLPAGGKLPASRVLADELDISRNTVLIAYEQLTAEGYVIADRQGTRVAPLSATAASAARQAAQRTTGRAADQATEQATGQSAGRGSLPEAPAFRTATRLSRIVSTRAPNDGSLPLTPGTPALTQFPINAWRRAQDRALQAAPAATLGYGPPVGEPALREAIAQYLRVSRGVRCDASRIVITEGAQGALALCVQLLTNPGDTAWLEEPGYRGAKSAFHAGDLNVVAMRVDADGVAITDDDWRARPPRLIQTTPTHQYPTGAVLSLARRLDLLERARRAGAWIIEDDYDSEFHYDGLPTACVQGLDRHGRTIYLGTFSKTLYPGLRMGYMALPDELVGAFSRARSIVDGHTPQILQLTLARFMADGHYNAHVRAMRKLYAARREAMLEAVGKHLAGVARALRPEGGLQVPCLLEPGWSEADTIRRAAQAGLVLPGLARLYAGTPALQGWLLGYASLSAHEIDLAMRRLAVAIRRKG